MNQAQRESVIRRLRDGQVEIVVATDVAARGLDVERISHVVNYDMPARSRVLRAPHRAHRPRRDAPAWPILFVTPREARMMREIERYTGQRVSR